MTFTRRALLPWPLATVAAVAATGGPAQALPARALRFPRDHGAHPELRTEWWYLTGHAQTEDGALYGFQVTFFRSRVDGAQPLQSRLAARHLLFAHAAITDVAGQRLHHDERIARWNGQPDARPHFAALDDTHVQIGRWWLQRQADGAYAMQVPGERMALELQATPTQAVLLQGEQGLSRKGPEPEQASHYYSQPHLQVQGTLRLDGRALRVRGTAWLDHEWSEALMHPDAVGWDWFGMNLDDGHSVTTFQLRRADGSKLWAGGSFRSRQDAHEPGAIYNFRPGEVDFSPRRFWSSPLTGARYPVEWLVRTPVDFYTVRALVDAQELDSRASTGTIYWEGLSELIDSNGRRVGRGYLEMTGYARRLRL